MTCIWPEKFYLDNLGLSSSVIVLTVAPVYSHFLVRSSQPAAEKLMALSGRGCQHEEDGAEGPRGVHGDR